MKRNGLGRLYDRLTAAERFRLDVLATARGGREGVRTPHGHLSALQLRHERGWFWRTLASRQRDLEPVSKR